MELSKAVAKALDEQIAQEASASHAYLAIANWCASEGFEGGAKFFLHQAGEEREHLLKFVTYLNGMGRRATIPSIAKPTESYDSLHATLAVALKQEKEVTGSINRLLDLAGKEKDHVTVNFLQDFIKDQAEDVRKFSSLISKAELIGTSGQALFLLDRELAAGADS